MPWLAILELMLPILLKLLENSPEDQAIAQMRKRGLFFRLRVANALRAEVLPELLNALESKLSGMSEEDMRELCQQAKAAKQAREGTEP